MFRSSGHRTRYCQNPYPTVVSKDTARFVDDRAHWGSRRHLDCDKGRFAFFLYGRQNLNRIRRFAQPPLNDGPSWLLSVQQFLEGFHGCSTQWEGEPGAYAKRG
jgi:hypothetical protein